MARYDRMRSHSRSSSRRYSGAKDDVVIDMSVGQEEDDAAARAGPEE